MKKIITTLLLLAGLQSAGNAQVTKANADSYAKQQTETMTSYLKLNEKQVKQVTDINRQFAVAKADAAGSVEKENNINQKMKARYQGVLTAEQMKMWEEHEMKKPQKK